MVVSLAVLCSVHVHVCRVLVMSMSNEREQYVESIQYTLCDVYRLMKCK